MPIDGLDNAPLNPPPQVALYDTPGVTSAVRSREHGARVQGAWQVAQHCGVVLFLVDAARQVRCHTRCRPAGACPKWRPVRLPAPGLPLLWVPLPGAGCIVLYSCGVVLFMVDAARKGRCILNAAPPARGSP